jgi:hypothetical protein
LSVIYALLFASLLTLIYHLFRTELKETLAPDPEDIRQARLEQLKDEQTKAKLKKDLWKIFSRYIRKKDADWKGYATCFTCGKYEDFRLVDAGHYIPKAGNSDALYFSELNVHPQCTNCNRLLDGNVTVYKDRLILKYGPGVILELNQLRNAPPFTIQDYQILIAKYTQLLKALK